MSDLKPCPCGQTPQNLCIAEGSTFRWRYICGDCGCGWEAEVRVPTIGDASEAEVYKSCVEDWNALPRGGDRITELEGQLAEALEAVREAYEVYAGSEGFQPETAPEAYQQRLLKQMAGILGEALAGQGGEG